jgi:hypothetical protein
MRARQGLKVLGTSIALGSMLAVAPPVSPAWATDISWHSTTRLTYQNGSNYRREGTAVVNTGETASFIGDGTNYLTNEKGVTPMKTQYMLRFEDGSTMTFRIVGGRNQFDGATFGSGEFLNGTGRFDGIAGKVTHTGQLGGAAAEGDWTGTYSLPSK